MKHILCKGTQSSLSLFPNQWYTDLIKPIFSFDF